MDVLSLRVGVVGELDLDGHHVGVRAEGLPAETVLDRKTLACNPVQEFVHLHRCRWSEGLSEKNK